MTGYATISTPGWTEKVYDTLDVAERTADQSIHEFQL